MKHSHYHKGVAGLQYIDVYRVLQLWEVTDPAIQHAIKKLLVPGRRGAGKEFEKDVQEAIDSLQRALDMRREDIARGAPPPLPVPAGFPAAVPQPMPAPRIPPTPPAPWGHKPIFHTDGPSCLACAPKPCQRMDGCPYGAPVAAPAGPAKAPPAPSQG